ncbi:hypothetical protein QBC39DRAFT_370428 [Podospora conica]|nr:hypothetical protein QBC39DRAFT_370428 [Schizothecium conicum]
MTATNPCHYLCPPDVLVIPIEVLGMTMSLMRAGLICAYALLAVFLLPVVCKWPSTGRVSVQFNLQYHGEINVKGTPTAKQRAGGHRQ